MPTTVEKARLYDRHRLPYAPQAVNDLLGYVGPVHLVADIGAGTGQLAQLFADRGDRLYAIEPDNNMRQVAVSALADRPSVQVCAGSAEQTTLTDNSVDLIVVGNAFHRFTSEACDELRRILKPGGWIALFIYTLTNRALSDALLADFSALRSVTDQMEESWHCLPLQSLFGDTTLHTLRYRQSRRDDWTTFFGMACGRLESPTPDDKDFAQFEAAHRTAFESFAVNGLIEIEYETLVTFGQPLVQPTVFAN
ncbi:MAG TPA: class I SAM-dependent methyltransferase [Pyrinomonadaceae bacterium]